MQKSPIKGTIYAGVIGMERDTCLNKVRLKCLTFEKYYLKKVPSCEYVTEVFLRDSEKTHAGAGP